MSSRSPQDLADGRPGPAFTVTLDGREIEALPGRTVAAALWSEGVTSWRATRVGGAPRGVFRGIGICYDCPVTVTVTVTVTVNDRPNQRACLVPLHPGDATRTQ
ncbi:(2Fe-2S)-binding protein [Streptomyces sp. W16]|uniref:(2Fe-2S)-binding protein n=1 Tax=Streptomyces sp. W16 TaxID=3076631 RepID=UPI00295AEF3A|nr:(2Fe-2S)-binding protein [Streptomyces sp. W16]MDV9168675.1 (2Fe-2S)-binding protein [Streptomyces sp. W16]